MSLIRASDPLALVAIQSGARPTPGTQGAAQGSNPLDTQQQAHAIGEPVPIVFGRRRNGAGGVFISPKATECRFENNASNAVTASYHLVLSEGRIGSLQVRDVFQRQCRVGSFRQTYNRRAGEWLPENAIVVRAGYDKPEATYLCGTVGTYLGISTLSFQVTVPDGFDVWNRQVHCFIRDGMQVYRWADATADVSSDSFADLAYWLALNSARIPASLIDTTSIQATSQFLNANNITTNCWITQAINYSELIARWSTYHLVRSSTRNGKAGLKPLLPVNGNGTIKVTALTVDYVFDDDLVIPGSEEISYTDWANRQPFVAQMIWRQQLDADVGIIRTAEVRYAGTASNGPYESHDLSAFCTREDHAVKVGAYLLAKRIRSTHSLRFKVRSQSHNTAVQQGSIVRVRLARNASGDVLGHHDYLYTVERITRTLAGDVQYECSHEPVDAAGRSLIALDVANTTGSGILLQSNLTGLGCDLNSSTDTTVPPDDEYIEPGDVDDGTEVDPGDDTPITEPGGGGTGGGGSDDPDPTPSPEDDLSDYQAGLYFHAATWNATTLTVQMRLAPTGKAPRQDLGALFATIASTSVVALLPGGQLASPQPATLPSVSFTGKIADPWESSGEYPALPVPPADRVFQGQFVISFAEGDFPPEAENPAQQLTYRATVAFSSWSGGFTDVNFLNTLTVDFVPTEAGGGGGVGNLAIYHPDTSPPLAIPGMTAEVTATGGTYDTELFDGVNSLNLQNGYITVAPTGTGGTWATGRTGFNTLEAYIKVPADAIIVASLLDANNGTIFKAAMWGNGTIAYIGDDVSTEEITHGISLTTYRHFAIGVNPETNATFVFLNGSRIFVGAYDGATPVRARVQFTETIAPASLPFISQIALSDVVVPSGTTITTPYLFPDYPFYVPAILLLHMDGANNSNVFTDSGPYSIAVTVAGNAKISTAHSKFGGASGLFDGNGDRLIISDARLALGTSDFTIETWIRPVYDNVGYKAICVFPELDDTGLYLFFYPPDASTPYVSFNTVWYDGYDDNFEPSIGSNDYLPFSGEWLHIAAVRQSGVISLFVDGVKQDNTYNEQPSLTGTVINIGGFAPLAEYYNGNLDELRISGSAVYTANFTPPAAPFS